MVSKDAAGWALPARYVVLSTTLVTISVVPAFGGTRRGLSISQRAPRRSQVPQQTKLGRRNKPF